MAFFLSIQEGVLFVVSPLIVPVVINKARCASCKARPESAWHLDTIGAKRRVVVHI